jgi:mannose-1-phosphate guanylyltransferase / mannose-6-phosphate isomerase
MITPIILSGGSGNRLWPISRQRDPKQFHKINSTNTLFQQTILRLDGVVGVRSPKIICNDEHRFIVDKQLNEIGKVASGIYLEQTPRNTLPALSASILELRNHYQNELVLVLPADHVITDNAAFAKAIERAVPAAHDGRIVCFGVCPDRPETGYGYLQRETDSDGRKFISDVHHVTNFKEKPDLKVANEYLANGNYFWNSGIFLFKLDTFIEELRRQQPSVFFNCYQAVKQSTTDLNFIRLNDHHFCKSPSISIDHGIMENAECISMVELKAGWSDMGSWNGVWETLLKDDHGNVSQGDAHITDSSDSCVYATSRLVATMGLQNTVVVETKDAVLVMDKSRSQDVKHLVENLGTLHREEVKQHSHENRPWGYFESLEKTALCQIKRLVVNPGARLSLQRHQHRSEHWVVLSGCAYVRNGNDKLILKPSESTFIAAGELHQLENRHNEPLEIIEVQTGSYFGEDDIERFEDDYGRTIVNHAA